MADPMRQATRRRSQFWAGCLTALALGFGSAADARAEFLVTLGSLSGGSQNTLITLESTTIQVFSQSAVTVGGVALAETIVGIDYRPTTRELFGLGAGGNLYVINPFTGAATLRAALTADPTDTTSPFAGLSGTNFGVDFNPVPDLQGNPSFRVTSDTGQNLRINANNGRVITDTDLTINGAAAGIVGVAYASNDVDPATGTTLFGITVNSGVATLVTATNANAGTYTNPRTLTGFGTFGSPSGVTGFDISGTGAAFAVFTYATPTGGITGELSTVDVNAATATPFTVSAGFNPRGVAALPALAPVPAPPTVVAAGLAAPALLAAARRRRAVGA